MKVCQPQELLLLTWHSTHVELCAILIEESEVRVETRARLNRRVPANQRHDLRLRMTSPEGGWLRIPVEPRVPFMRIREKGHSLTSAPPVPGEGTVNLHRGHVHICDLVTVIDETYLYFLNTDMRWNRRILPNDITTYDVSFDPAGGLWVVGKAPSLKIPHFESKIAIRYQHSELTTFESHSLRPKILSLVKAMLNGGLEQLHTIDAEDNPVVTISDCAWFVDDPSSFLFLRSSSGQWDVRRLAGQFVRRLVRPTSDTLLIFTVEGSVFKVRSNGSIHLISNSEALRAVLYAACPYTNSVATKLLVRGADAKNGKLVVVAGLYQVTEAGLSWLITGACQSIDAGKNWSVLAKTFPFSGENELIDVAILSSVFPSLVQSSSP
jgi:hypothetical protein